jgi:hypothetical protein
VGYGGWGSCAFWGIILIKRYTEECLIVKESKSACKKVIESMFIPGFTAITTDAMGIILIALTPIPILQKITLSCTFWCIAQVIIAIILVPIILSFLPVSPRLLKKFERKGILDRILVKVGSLIGGRGSLVVFAMVPLLIILGYLGARTIQVGDAVPGSSLFWPWHRYNQDGFRIAFSMPILSPLYIVMEGEKIAFSMPILSPLYIVMEGEKANDLVSCPGKPREQCGENLSDIYRFQKFMRDTPGRLVMFVDSAINTFASSNWLMHEGDPNWHFFPPADREIVFMFIYSRDTGVPGSSDRYCDGFGNTAANIIIYCRDKTTSTIETVMASY